MRQLKRFIDVLSPESWLYLNLFNIIYPVVFPLSWKLIVIAIVFDGLVMIPLTRLLTMKLLSRHRPLSRFYISELKIQDFKSFDVTKKVAFIEDLMGFPAWWARRCFLSTFLKMIPVIAFFTWAVSRAAPVPIYLQLMKFAVVILLMNTYFASAIFLESHGLASKYIAECNRACDLKPVFERLKLPPPGNEFQFRENTAIACIWIFMLSLQLLLIETLHPGGVPLLISLPLVSLTGLLLVTRISTLSRRYLFGGLHEIFDTLNKFDPNEQGEILALHSLPLLAHFERIINSLTDRLRNYERELSGWIFKKAEEGRYSAMGEISGLVVHDLSGPLHVVHFCTQQLLEEPERIFDDRYREQLAMSGERALDLITALKSYLRAPSAGAKLSVNFGEAHKYVLKLLGTQFHGGIFSNVHFDVSSEINRLNLRINRPDLIHILMNLHANSIENFVENKNPHPHISVNVSKTSEDGETEILIADNGTGLSSERFEEMTSFAFQNSNNEPAKGSLGLRLVRRLVERYGGTLTVDPFSPQGTLFRLRLKTNFRVEEAVLAGALGGLDDIR